MDKDGPYKCKIIFFLFFKKATYTKLEKKKLDKKILLKRIEKKNLRAKFMEFLKNELLKLKKIIIIKTWLRFEWEILRARWASCGCGEQKNLWLAKNARSVATVF